MSKISRLFVIVFLAATMICCGGCKVKQLSSTEIGIQVVKMPDFVGGGIKEELIAPGSLKIYPFWSLIYVMDTQIQSYSWAGKGHGDSPDIDETINTRAADGNEVNLSMTLQYHFMPDKVLEFLWEIGDAQGGQEAVSNWARSHIRTYLGFLKTEEFYDSKRYQQCDVVKASLNRDLERFGIRVDKVIFDEHAFDENYQKLIDSAKESEQKAQGKANEVKTKEADWKMQLQTAIGQVNQMIAEADGRKRQVIATADAYFEARKNEAEAIKVSGEKEVEGIKKQIAALQQSGGENIVRLEYGQALLKSRSHFLVLPGGGDGFNLNTTNYNDLLRTMGAASLAPNPPANQEAAAPKKETSAASAPAPKK
jgi:regulator of protease activity HflC (stomatin/prohibitin superfamily)